jgi:hypothetical protein
MAEALLQLRAVYLSGDFEPYWAFHGAQEPERLHPPGHWQPVAPIPDYTQARY